VRRLSVVVPTHDTRELTLRCLASLAFLEAEDAQVVLVDDGSRDGTLEAARRAHPWIEVLVNDAAAGFARAANRGLAAARGSLLLLLNSDTELDRDSFERARHAFASDPRLGIAGASLVNPDGSPQWSGGRWPTAAWMVGLASGLPALVGRLPGYRRLRPPSGAGGGAVDWVTGAAMLIRREAWTAAGPLDETFAFYGQDLALCWSARTAGWNVRLLRDWRVLHVGGASIGRRAGAHGGVHQRMLWADLLRWTSRRHGAAAAVRTARWMRAAATARIAGRAALGPFSGSAWDEGTAALREARSALDGWADDRPTSNVRHSGPHEP
jgi:GT2 family glycosyltransferase